ncbi:MAG: hypothetical protein LBS59_04535 [Puniceicoccales bacterium]|jgi:cell division protein FtsB|nr:hypothetical protein [Puniceicoccales bacterium]
MPNSRSKKGGVNYGHFHAGQQPAVSSKRGAKKKKPFGEVLQRFAMQLLGVVSVFIFLIIFSMNIISFFEENGEIERLEKKQEEIAKREKALEWENRKNETHLSRLQNSEYLMDLLRERHGFALPGEKILSVIPPQTTP